MQLVEFFRSRRGGELIGIVVVAIGISLAAALLTYHPRDSSAFYTSTDIEIRNAIGYYGATLAWIFVGFFGFASLLFPAVLLVGGWNRFWGRDIEYFHTKLIGFVILTTALPPLFDLAFGKVWLRGSLIASGGYLGHELNRAVSGNLNTSGAVIALVTALLIGLLLATRISLAAVFLAIHQQFVALGRTMSLQWARFTERRRKEKMKDAIVRKHLEKVEPPPLRLVPPVAEDDEEDEPLRGPIVREVKGAGKFQIRKVTKADLRKAAEALAQQETQNPFELYTAAPSAPAPRVLPSAVDAPPAPKPRKVAAPPPPPIEEEELEDPLFEDLDLPVERPKPLIPRPAARRPAEKKREIKLTHDHLPPMNLLTEGPKQDGINDEVHKKFLEIGHLIEDRCREFSVEGEVTAYHPGPVVTTFEFKPSAGVKYAKVVNLGDDLALALKAESIRIERISGSSTVGIEVPNRKRELIALRDIIDTETFHASSSLLSLALGKDIHGEPVVTDLAKMPHLLVAGATGAGKSVGLNSMIVSLLYKALPKDLRMLMIDPKMVELKVYEDIPHLLHPIITDPKLASHALIWAVNEMENRYRTLAECGVRNIEQYNSLLKDPDSYRRAKKLAADAPTPADDPLQYIVVIIDEFADLMMVASKDVEDSVTRLAQKARAVGIHLIIATQRPSVDVITGVIKANLPSRISFQVASKIDSRTILDAQGAEKLLGNGDMLFLPPGTARVRRLHGAYVSESEINDIVEFVKKNQGAPQFLEEITKVAEEKNGADGVEYLEDPKYDDAVRVVLTTGQASASYLQRRLKLGYSRAARLIEIMEANGIVGPSQGSKPREILVRADDYPPAAGDTI
ncbi:MAG TPA: DNA translocase FtsK 4TM domain-containing protein [Thermoanaerobaculia bacterium]|nr:DNA translocase FtsK 4TM domain-containing protein [Thermoanaerobaculia bacterium]